MTEGKDEIQGAGGCGDADDTVVVARVVVVIVLVIVVDFGVLGVPVNVTVVSAVAVVV